MSLQGKAKSLNLEPQPLVVQRVDNATGGDNSNKRCLSSSVCKIKSSRKFERPSRLFQ